MGRKCAVPECLSEEGRDEDRGVTFHKIPHHTDLRPKWLSLCHVSDDKQNLKVLHVCSRHFLKANFCNYKGKKYVLRQGVLPTVFPWNKLKRAEVVIPQPPVKKDSPAAAKPDEVKLEVKDEPVEPPETKATDGLYSLDDSVPVKYELAQNSSTIEQRGKSVQTSTGLLNFATNTRLEALDFNSVWQPARIVEIDYEEDEVLVHFEKCSSKLDEWISMSSSRLRSVQSNKRTEAYAIDEEVMANWTDARKFRARVTKIVDKDTYEVTFTDGYVKVLKAQKLSKISGGKELEGAAKGPKRDRRNRKRKANEVESSSKKRPRVSSVPEDTDAIWIPKWDHGRPVGTESTIETEDGVKQSIVVPDPMLPPEWQKHLVKRTPGSSTRKWETIILSPDGQMLRSKFEAKAFLEQNPHFNYAEKSFNFYNHRRPSKTNRRRPPKPSTTNLQIRLIDDGYMCPIELCGKSFRRVNLAQMHVKHYHPEYTKFLDCTPNVADLAYARTVGESLDKSPERATKTSTPKAGPKTATPRSSTPKTAVVSPPPLPVEPEPVKPSKESDLSKPLPDSTAAKLSLPTPQDLFSGKTDAVVVIEPPLKISNRPGIKTLLPVVRPPEIKSEPRQLNEPEDQKTKRKPEDVPLDRPTNPPDYIVEGGELIKIVRMRREEIINCTCGIKEEDGLMIQCEVCLCWQHAYCNNIERENQVPEKYVCYICQNPARQRASRKYFHDQDWLKTGTLPVGNYHCRDAETHKKRFDELRKIHDLKGGLLELKGFMHTLDVKMKIAKSQNHPKLYLWSKPWPKQPLYEKQELEDEKPKTSAFLDFPTDKSARNDPPNLLLKDEDFGGLGDVPPMLVPQPEAAIESADCQLNLLEHIVHSQGLVEERLKSLEEQVDVLDLENVSSEEDYGKACRTVQMLLKDLGKLKELCYSNAL